MHTDACDARAEHAKDILYYYYYYYYVIAVYNTIFTRLL